MGKRDRSEIVEEVPAAGEAVQERKKKKRKKNKSVEATPESSVDTQVPDEEPVVVEGEKKKKKKKKNKTAESSLDEEKQEEAPAESPESSPAESEEPEKKKKKKKKSKAVEEEAVVVAKKDSSSLDIPTTTKDNPWWKENKVTLKDCETLVKPLESFGAASSFVDKQLVDYVENKFKGGKPSLIQAVSWPLIMSGKDMFGIAKTGSGKTLSFALPFFAKCLDKSIGEPIWSKGGAVQPRMVCVAPTKELIQQITEVCVEVSDKLGKGKYPVQCVIGGMPKGAQIRQIRSEGCDICCATPGRLLDLMNDGVLDLSETRFFVLDEGDRMLDMGFIQDMRKISEACSRSDRQTVFFSATWPLEVNRIARSLVRKERQEKICTVTVASKTADGSGDKRQFNPDISQEVICIKDNSVKWDLLIKQLSKHDGQKTLVFGLYKNEVARLEDWLQRGGYSVRGIQGDMTQDKRTQAMTDFKTNKCKILVATDVAARGLDIPDVELVINYTFPLTIEDLVHRTGRTGRAGKKGKAVTFFNENGDHKEKEHVFDLIQLLEGAKQPVSADLQNLNKNTFTATKKKKHGMYGDFFKSEEEMAKLSKLKVQMTFDSDSD